MRPLKHLCGFQEKTFLSVFEHTLKLMALKSLGLKQLCHAVDTHKKRTLYIFMRIFETFPTRM